MGWLGVGQQVQVGELALCIHSQDEVLLSYIPSLGSGSHSAWAQVSMVLQSADWQWNGLS